ncbi:unnamed protein product [Spirodela intermedia]|uniref:Cupin-like domain-containing protein n=1 Tax=Spirodela intermedia TaxID=51605 RepID=A0A7I8I7V1_SPIIN|nr:unnamed protein product [Spirodela intermedia]CAA6653717.1 unnamed protein product [Spirodela intermedia]
MEAGEGEGSAAEVTEVLRVRRVEALPSPEHFCVIESANVPAVFVAAVKDWNACSSWDPRSGGLDYLLDKVGSTTVEAMLSRSGPVFYGGLRNHERVPLPFSDFIKFCQQNSQLSNQNGPAGAEGHIDTASTLTYPTFISTNDQVYLAQVPILTVENNEKSPLQSLIDDIEKPIFLETNTLASINFWMNNVESRSSIHYDPHHNLLCVIAGRKQVFLWPPSAGCFLYPMPVYGEASNHSSLDIQNPDFSRHSRAKHYMEYSKRFHQVDSEDLTIAVNFWWHSTVMGSMLEHMDAYYLRRILNRLVDKEMNEMLSGKENGPNKATDISKSTSEASKGPIDTSVNEKTERGNGEKKGLSLEQLEPLELQALNEIVSLVHESVKVASQDQSYVQDSFAHKEDNQEDKRHSGSSFIISEDPVAGILQKMKPRVLQSVLLAMVHSFPRTLEALILQSLSPLAAEILTRKFDELDQQTSKKNSMMIFFYRIDFFPGEFFQLFYGVFDDHFAAMDSILNGKESFSFQILCDLKLYIFFLFLLTTALCVVCRFFRNVLNQYLGVDVSMPKQ